MTNIIRNKLSLSIATFILSFLFITIFLIYRSNRIEYSLYIPIPLVITQDSTNIPFIKPQIIINQLQSNASFSANLLKSKNIKITDVNRFILVSTQTTLHNNEKTLNLLAEIKTTLLKEIKANSENKNLALILRKKMLEKKLAALQKQRESLKANTSKELSLFYISTLININNQLSKLSEEILNINITQDSLENIHPPAPTITSSHPNTSIQIIITLSFIFSALLSLIVFFLITNDTIGLYKKKNV